MFNFLKKQHFSKDPKYRNLLVLMAENFSNQATSTVLGHEKIKIKGEATGCLPNENFVIGYILCIVPYRLFISLVNLNPMAIGLRHKKPVFLINHQGSRSPE